MRASDIHRLAIGWLLATLSVVGFASTFVVGAELTKGCGVSPEVLSFLRFLFASLVMLAFRPPLPRTWRDRLAVCWLGPVGTALMAWFVFLGCARVSAANASMADALTPLMIFVAAAVKARAIALRGIVGVAVGLVGALLVIQVVNARGIALEAYALGDVFVLLAAVAWGVYTVWGRPVIARLGSFPFTAWTMLAGALAVGVCLPFLDVVWPSGLKAWGLVVCLASVSTLLPFWTWNAAQKYLSVPVLGISAYFTPVFAVALAVVFLGERATALQWLGSVLIAASAVVETKGEAHRTV